MGIVGRSLAPTNMSRIFLVCFYAITGGRVKIWPPPYMPADDFFLFLFFFKIILLTRIVEGWYRRFKISLSSSAVTWLFCNISCRRISLTKYIASFIMSLEVVSVGEEVFSLKSASSERVRNESQWNYKEWMLRVSPVPKTFYVQKGDRCFRYFVCNVNSRV